MRTVAKVILLLPAGLACCSRAAPEQPAIRLGATLPDGAIVSDDAGASDSGAFDAGVLAICTENDLAIGTTLTPVLVPIPNDGGTKVEYQASDGHYCKHVGPNVVVDLLAGTLTVSEHVATELCNHLNAIGCPQGPACVGRLGRHRYDRNDDVPQCVMGAHRREHLNCAIGFACDGT